MSQIIMNKWLGLLRSRLKSTLSRPSLLPKYQPEVCCGNIYICVCLACLGSKMLVY